MIVFPLSFHQQYKPLLWTALYVCAATAAQPVGCASLALFVFTLSGDFQHGARVGRAVCLRCQQNAVSFESAKLNFCSSTCIEMAK